MTLLFLYSILLCFPTSLCGVLTFSALHPPSPLLLPSSSSFLLPSLTHSLTHSRHSLTVVYRTCDSNSRRSMWWPRSTPERAVGPQATPGRAVGPQATPQHVLAPQQANPERALRPEQATPERAVWGLQAVPERVVGSGARASETAAGHPRGTAAGVGTACHWDRSPERALGSQAAPERTAYPCQAEESWAVCPVI